MGLHRFFMPSAGKPKESKDCHERALVIYLKNLGPEHEKVAASYNNLGLAHRQLGDLNSDLSIFMSQHVTITWVFKQ